jgi:threonine/homoserine/homoserine lactone efflux protein
VPEPSTFLVFLAATIALLAVPGPVVIFVVTRSVTQGRIAGLVSVLGVHTGSVVHVAAAALGISALLAASATAFGVVRYLGAAYLIFLGLQRLLRRGPDDEVVDVTPTPRAHLYRQGIVVNVLNPKTAIFFLAFLPQFANPARGPVAIQIAVLGICFILLGLASDSTYALLSGTVSGRLRRSASVRRHLDRVSGVIYLGLGATAALAGEGGRRA